MVKYGKLIITILLIMLPTIIFGMVGKTVEMSIMLIAGFVSAVLINIERFKSFKAGKIEAVLKEANQTIDHLKEVAEPLLSTNLVSLAYEGYFDGMNVDEKIKSFAKLIELKNKLELKSDTINDSVNITKKSIAHHLFREIGNSLGYDDLSKDSLFFSKYSIESTDAFATVEETEYHLKEISQLNKKQVKESFEKFQKFIKTYY